MQTNRRSRLSKQPKVLRYPSEQEADIWLKRRQGVIPSVIADKLEVSRAYVSKALRKAEEKIGGLIEHAALINRIQLHHYSPEHGIGIGYCASKKSETIIAYSPRAGLHVWSRHKGDCSHCADFGECAELINSLSKEWKIPVARNAGPVEVLNDIFHSIFKELNWQD